MMISTQTTCKSFTASASKSKSKVSSKFASFTPMKMSQCCPCFRFRNHHFLITERGRNTVKRNRSTILLCAQSATTKPPQSDDKSESNNTKSKNIVSFRPCIDIHLGKVKQIVGSSLRDESSVDEEKPETNFETDVKSSEFAEMYKRDNIYGGHAILLSKDLETKEAALEATRAFPGGLQIGGGVTAETALEYLENGASHVIVTSYVFHDGKLDEEKLEKLIRVIGKERLVLDLSCRRDEKDGNKYKVVTDRWQKWTDVCVDEKTLARLSEKCDEFLVHGVDVEGKKMGLDLDLVELLGKYCSIPVTYAGGARSIEDLELVKTYGQNRVDVTIGSALDCFGGSLKYADVIDWHNKQRLVLK
ncbi:unnamed protein product [Bathycoccus prasinos]